MDNYAAHKRVEVRNWLTANPRIKVHFTPTSGSWLNLVEVWFGIIERQADGTWYARPCGKQDSHRILHVSRANAYLIIPAESGSLEAGQSVTVQPFDGAFL